MGSNEKRTSGILSEHVSAIFKGYRNHAVILFVGLAILTVLSCLPYTPQGPFDARDYSRIAGMRVEQHQWEALIEPLAAPFHILAGAPDLRISGVSALIWLFLGAGAWGMLAEFRSQRKRARFAIVLKGIRRAFVATSTVMLVIFLFVAARIPGWRLIVDHPDLIVADLHSHTVKSFDGLMSTQANLELHASCGYDVVGLTEHDQLFTPDTEMPAGSSPDLPPAVIAGLETHTGPRVMVLGLCRDPRIQLTEPGPDLSRDRTSMFVKRIHEDCAGAVIVVTLNELETGDVARLADAGVDGFEIANSGHPDLRPDLRQEVLQTCLSRGLVLVASTDWHGWSGLARTWTVIRAPGACALSRTQQATLVMRKLREHNSEDVIPVVAGYMGEPSLMRAIFSPVAETLRYALELSAARVISWWFWISALFVIWALLRRIGVRPGGVLLALLIGGTGLGLIVSGVSLIGQGTAGTESYSFRIGFIALTAGAAAFLASMIEGLSMALKRRRQKNEQA
ncbi:MAG: hypothetical protein ABSG91_24160 [Syntrophobacteraceae bacterium]|jgi:hypothetical protein